MDEKTAIGYNAGMLKISVVVLVRNEEENIAACLKSVEWADEIIVVDDYSGDKTTAIAQNFGAKIIKRELENNFAAQRNFGLSKTVNEWVLFVDADERVSKELRDEIMKTLKRINIKALKRQQTFSGNNGSVSAYRIKREDYVFGKRLRYGETGDIKLIRLAKKGTGSWRRRVHEYWEIDGKIGELESPIIHYPHKNISDFVENIRKYALLHAQALKEEGKKGGLWKIILYPPGKFIYNYVIKQGFRDGTVGFVHAMLMSFHSFSAYAQLYFDKETNSMIRYKFN